MNAITELQRIFGTYTFPEMKVDWRPHPINVGHLYFSGCFRCHDGEHVSSTGKVVNTDCNICHSVLYDSARLPGTLGTGPSNIRSTLADWQIASAMYAINLMSPSSTR